MASASAARASEAQLPGSEGIASAKITFLGTASAQPSSSRNHSSLALHLDGDVWLFDCGEATQHQVQKSPVKMGKIKKIFITHTHGDHIFGIAPLLASRLNGAGGMADSANDPRLASHEQTVGGEPLEIYGPLGTRAYVRNALTYTHTILAEPYVVHELRFASDPQDGDFTTLEPPAAELRDGRNIPQNADGTWPCVFDDGVVSVSAAPIYHSVPCVGYVVQEAPVPGKLDPKEYVPHLKRTNTPMSALRQLKGGASVTLNDGTVLQGPARRLGRKIAILGDTHDPSPIAALAEDCDMLVHEATNAFLLGVDPETKADETVESVEARTRSRGHSTPQMAGKFAARVGARTLVLNHFSARYKDDGASPQAKEVMQTIGRLAQAEFGRPVVCARDLMTVDVERKG